MTKTTKKDLVSSNSMKLNTLHLRSDHASHSILPAIDPPGTQIIQNRNKIQTQDLPGTSLFDNLRELQRRSLNVKRANANQESDMQDESRSKGILVRLR